jgi:hypothetical protein
LALGSNPLDLTCFVNRAVAEYERKRVKGTIRNYGSFMWQNALESLKR